MIRALQQRYGLGAREREVHEEKDLGPIQVGFAW